MANLADWAALATSVAALGTVVVNGIKTRHELRRAREDVSKARQTTAGSADALSRDVATLAEDVHELRDDIGGLRAEIRDDRAIVRADRGRTWARIDEVHDELVERLDRALGRRPNQSGHPRGGSSKRKRAPPNP